LPSNSNVVMNGLFRFSVLGGILIDGGLYGVLWGRSKAEKQEIHNSGSPAEKSSDIEKDSVFCACVSLIYKVVWHVISSKLLL
jgi:hypothetical protein